MPDGKPNITRHPINDRKHDSIRAQYKQGILEHGIMTGCRGEPWLLQSLVLVIGGERVRAGDDRMMSLRDSCALSGFLFTH